MNVLVVTLLVTVVLADLLRKAVGSSRKHSPTMSCDEIPMDVLFSEGSLSSTAPTSPSSSPLFRPSDVDDLKLSQLSQARESLREYPRAHSVKNVCFVGAGYVGRSSPFKHLGLAEN